MNVNRTGLIAGLSFGLFATLLAGCGTTKSLFRPQSSSVEYPALEVKYPTPVKGDTVDDYHGTAIADPFRDLEKLDSPSTQAWVEAQNKITFAYLESIPARQALNDRLTTLWNYEKYGTPRKVGNRYFFSKNDGLQNQNVIYTVDSLNDEPRVLLDPNPLSPDGTVALTNYSISDDGKLMAYGISRSGSDWREFRVRNVETGQDLGDHLNWVKFSGISWSSDHKGFFYSRYDDPSSGKKMEDLNYYQKLYYHRVGTSQSEDVLIYERPDEKEWFFSGTVSEDGDYLIISIAAGTEPKNRVFYKDLRQDKNPVIELLDDFDARYTFVGNEGTAFWFLTDLDAPRYRLISIDITTPVRDNWKEILPENEATLRSVGMVNNLFVAKYLTDAHSTVKIHNLDGTLVRNVDLPGIGSASGFGGRHDDTETFYSFSGFTTPTTIYHYDMASGKSTVFREPTVDFDPSTFETKQVFYKSKDGTKIPMFIVHKKGITLDGQNPTLLYGYGGFNIPQTPRFSVANLVWMEMGGIYATPNLRGGGEYGREWHQAGTKHNKQNVFDDFIAAAEYLIAEKYTSTPKLAIRGGSNGGLLVGACMTQRPDLFGACLPAVGVMDMLRFHKFTIGWAWVSDYGSADASKEEFDTLHAYSPLHNLTNNIAYPATMVTTADHDDRVVPGHSYKFAARLQEAHTGKAPVLIRIAVKAGHGAGKPTKMVIQEQADMFSFLVKNLDMKIMPGS